MFLCMLFLFAGIADENSVIPASSPATLTAIDTKPFGSSIQHWRQLRAPGRFIVVEPNQPSYQPGQVTEIVANILLFQRDNGGWPKDYDMTAVLTDAQREQVLATQSKEDTSFDNGNIHSQVEYLAKAVAQYPDLKWKRACERGFDFLLRAQYDNGGFPQRFPDPRGYPAHITFNDGVMIGILKVLHDAASEEPHFRWLDDERRRRAAQAVEKGINCILNCQIRVEHTLTGWCQQHDEVTFEPRPARTFELASLCPQDTTEIVRFLMRQRTPSKQLIHAVESAVGWLDSVQIEGFRVEKVSSSKESFPGYDTDKDAIVVADENAKPIWARHYEIGTNRPIFAGRNAVKCYSLAEIERERRVGTAWYGYWPEKLLSKEFPKWRLKRDEKVRD